MPADEDPWWDRPPSSTIEELPDQVGLEAESGTGLDELASLLNESIVLNSRESCVLQLRFGLDRGGVVRSVPEMTRELGVAETRIRQIEANALAKIRRHRGLREKER